MVDNTSIAHARVVGEEPGVARRQHRCVVPGWVRADLSYAQEGLRVVNIESLVRDRSERRIVEYECTDLKYLATPSHTSERVTCFGGDYQLLLFPDAEVSCHCSAERRLTGSRGSEPHQGLVHVHAPVVVLKGDLLVLVRRVVKLPPFQRAKRRRESRLICRRNN